MEIPLNVDVFCGPERCGRSTQLIINPLNDQVTHLVVADEHFPNTERMVPAVDILETTHDSIKLSIPLAQFATLEPFIETDFIRDADNNPIILPSGSAYAYLSYGMYEPTPLMVEKKHIPVGEIAIHRGTPVFAKDDRIGKVDEFLVYPTNDGISHLILREGHLWGQKDVIISVDEIEKITDEGVFLKLDKKSVELLPALPIKQMWK